MLRDILIRLKKTWPEVDKLNATQQEINRLVWGLDEVAIGYEAKWGVYRLESLAAEPMASKWQSQIDKLNAAIEAQDINLIRDLVEGCKRGYAALEKSALDAGHKPYEPEFYEIKRGSCVYRIVKSVADSHALHRPGVAQGVVILSLEELINIFESTSLTAGKKLKEGIFSIPNDKGDMDWDRGDSIPWLEVKK